MADLAPGKPGEQRGLLGHCSARLLDVGAVVQADADDLVGVRNDRGKFEGLQREIGRGVPRNGPGFGQGVGREQRPQCWPSVAEAAAKVDHPAVLDHAVAGAPC